jgi:hypothetical protein
MSIEDSDNTKPGIVKAEIIEDGNTALLHIRQIGGEILKFTVPTRPLVEPEPTNSPEA